VKKLHLKSLVIGFIIGSICFTTISLAATRTLKNAYFNNDIKVVVNNKELKLNYPVVTVETNEDAYGKNYLPIAPLAEALNATAKWDGKTKTINIQSNNMPNINNTADDNIPILQIGETYKKDGLEITIEKLEYLTASEKGFRVYFSIVNNSDNPLISTGILQFKLNDTKYQNELNSGGCRIKTNKKGYIYPNESASGYFEYFFEKDIEINEIVYHIGIDGSSKMSPVAKWVIKKE